MPIVRNSSPLQTDLQAGHRGRPLLLLVLLILIFVSPYAFRIPWRFAWASLLLILSAAAFYRLQGRPLLGLQASPMQMAAALAVALAVWWAAGIAVGGLSKQAGLILVPFDSTELFFGKPFFQSLNEEIILRAILLTLLATLWPATMRASGLRAWLLPGLAALIFAGLHWVYYNLISSIELHFPTLLTLFFVGFALNGYFLRSGHILFGVAIHAGWNLVRFGGQFFSSDPTTGVREYIKYAHTFNIFEGSPHLLVASAALALLAAWLLWNDGSDHPETARSQSD